MTGSAFRRKTYEVLPTAQAPRVRPWWQSCGLDDFRNRVAEINGDERLALHHEIKAAISATQKVIENTSATTDHRERARHALHHMSERRHVLASLFRASDRNAEQGRTKRPDRIASARRALDQDDLRTALSVILDILENKHSVDPEDMDQEQGARDGLKK